MLQKVSKNTKDHKGENADILQDLSIGDNWLMDRIMTQKLKYFGCVQRHNGSERKDGQMCKGQPVPSWSQAVEDTLDMKSA